MTLFDEDFTDDDMASAIDWHAEQRNLCDGCGFPLDESTAPGRDDAYDAEMVACHACAAADRVAKTYRDQKGEQAGVRRRVWEVDP